MNNSISIRPSKDIRNNYAQISALAKNNPVAITVNGKEDSVLLSTVLSSPVNTNGWVVGSNGVTYI